MLPMQSALRLLVSPVLLLVFTELVPADDGRETAVRDAGRIEGVLDRWARASKSLSPLSEAEKRTISDTYKHVHSGHELAVALEFRGPVRAADLVAKYRWTGVEATDRAVRLTAVPRDDVERLFFRGFEVTLDPRTHLPVSIRFTPRSGRPQSRPLGLVPKLEHGRIEVVSAVRPAAGGTAGQIVPTAAESIDPATAPRPSRLQRPADGELREVLRKWEAASSRIRRLQARFTRIEYDTVFNVEKRATGMLHYEAPHNGRIDIRPAEIAVDAGSLRRNRRGEPFRLEASTAETWIWTDRETLRINEPARSFTRLAAPADGADDSKQSLWAALSKPLSLVPLQVDVRARDLERRFVVTMTKRTNDAVWLSLVPRRERDIAAYSKLDVILDAEKFTMRAIRIIDPTGNLETVYVFDEITINGPGDSAADPFKPDLSGYREQ